MFYYLGTFILSLTFVYYSERAILHNKMKKFLFLSFVAIFLPCLLAGIRGASVGTDVRVYVIPQYDRAQAYSNFLSYYAVSNCELLYAALVFLCAKLQLGVTVLMFLVQLLTILPIYLIGVKKRENLSMTFLMLVYYFLFYNFSLNIMRQSIATALLLLALIYFEENNYKLCFCLCIVAIFFHASALLSIIMFAVFKYASNGGTSFIKKATLVCATFILATNIYNIVDFFTNRIRLLPLEYYDRLLRFSQDADVSWFSSLLRGVLIFFPFLVAFMSKSKDAKFDAYNYMSLMGYIFSFFSNISQYLIRFSYYYQFMFILTLPSALKKITKKNYQRYIWYMIISLILVIYWYITCIAWGWHGTMPYVIGNL